MTVGGRVGGRVSLSSSQGGSSDAMTLTIYDITNQFIGESVTVKIEGDSMRYSGNCSMWDLHFLFLELYSPTLYMCILYMYE